ncbi:uncharacterized protein P884DRAFT_260043 [Thermothelomyces heterothallicus CBS 202.75]|uniref:uncharacterized protein n=1 Tax=Thermothelomyces heterothallicus CBS 202.75 TaxID=1149848 RepID=UPI00374497A8
MVLALVPGRVGGVVGSWKKADMRRVVMAWVMSGEIFRGPAQNKRRRETQWQRREE